MVDRGSQLEKTCFQQCPTLAKRAKFINFSNWSDETLVHVAQTQLEDEAIKSMAGNCAQIYRQFGWNMAQFHFLLDSLREIHESKTREIFSRRKKLEQGLSKLSEASDTVKVLEEKVKEQGMDRHNVFFKIFVTAKTVSILFFQLFYAIIFMILCK